ncbi:MAG TPA: PIN domain-containing protein [Candidatus Competibacter sp.]|nr:PIN domain-containing protein [Candidatus Competibacter sp.]
MRIYLDNCAFNRPFDGQSQIRIRLESEAKLYIQEKIKSREIELVWSYVLDVENEHNPFEERKKAIEKWKSIAVIDVEETRDLIVTANSLLKKGVRPKDALHVASAIEGKASYFLTTDDKLIKKLSNICEIQIINPVDMVGIIDEHDD